MSMNSLRFFTLCCILCTLLIGFTYARTHRGGLESWFERYIPLATSVAQTTTTSKRLYNPTISDIVMEFYNIQGISMEPLISNGAQVKVLMNYYNDRTHLINRGDIVIFENPFSLKRIIKRVAIIPEDTIKKDYEKKTIYVNGILLKNSVGIPYIFDEVAYHWIDIYTKSGSIVGNVYFLLGDNVYHSIDSRQTGPISLEGILGKVELQDVAQILPKSK